MMHDDECSHCGEVGIGSKKLMFYRLLEKFPDLPIAREFICMKCQRRMRVYATIGLVLLGGMLLAAAGGVVWIRFSIPELAT